jgi:hypothetical protein
MGPRALRYCQRSEKNEKNDSNALIRLGSCVHQCTRGRHIVGEGQKGYESRCDKCYDEANVED